MSLIYQALRQMEQRDAAAVPVRAAPAPVRPAAPVAPAARPHRWLWGAAGVLLAGLAVGAWQGSRGGNAGGQPEATARQEVPPVTTPSASDQAVAKVATVAAPAPEPALPRAQTPLPLARAPLAPVPEQPPVRQAAAVPPSAGSTVSTSSTAAPQAVAVSAAPSVSSVPAPVPAPTPAPASAEQAIAEPVPETAPVEDMRVLFDRFNRALSTQDRRQARLHLDTIQERLPASSVARWRAEAWFAYQTDDLERARDIYRGLLDKLPGDENASLSLVAIEQRLNQPGAARAVLEASLRHNPNSAPLRTALDRLEQSEAGR